MSDAQNWTATDLQQALIEKASNGEVGAPPEVLSAPTRQTALALANYVLYYNSDDPENPDDIEEDGMYQLLLSRLETLTAHEAVRSGDVSSMRGIAGAPTGDGDTDTSSWRAADIITRDLWKPDDRDNMLNMILYGPTPSIKKGSNTGTGKSDFAYTLAEGGRRAYNGELEIATNNDTDPFKQVEKWSEAEEWMQETDGPKLLILDEAAQGLKHQDMSAGDVLGLAIRLMRKYNCHLVLISHTGKDIPKDIRRQVVYARKEDKKGAKLGNKLEEDPSGEMRIKNVEYELGRIPPTNIEYDSYDDKGEFEWDIDGEDEEKEVVDEKPQCQAETNSGSQCPNDAKHPSGDPLVCVNHRHKLDEIVENE
ncbi:AAA family ATPase [Haloarchaeobius litoreus]|uniref:AAA family ATPase n=1 Tax=Haloarchaeobius litoreus TaxID=755306 RepID=A0ABD6DJZ0_9EURY|nr:AAA family ATPase [Haloarchaeobius litoreus]